MSEGEAKGRIIRARELASHPDDVETIGENLWSVPSQSGFGRYRVYYAADCWACECKDFQARYGEPCKHILAIRELLHPTRGPARTLRKQYPQNSAAYDAGQVNEVRLVDGLLRDLVLGVEDIPRPPGRGGRPSVPLRDALYCAILKVYSGLSARRASGVWQNAKNRGLLGRVPSYRLASRLLSRPEVTPILYRVVSLSAFPLAGLETGGVVAPDSTGVQTTSFGGWREAKHGETRVKKWLKVHALVGTRTHVIIRAIVGDENSADAPMFPQLVQESIDAGFRPGSIVADKGYLSQSNYSWADAFGLEAYIPFKSDTVSNEVRRIRGLPAPPAWEKAYHLFQANREEFDRHYHTRSNVESAFSALKRKLGENVRSRTTVAQINEILCKLIAYNLTVVVHEMFENGIAPRFWEPNGKGSNQGSSGAAPTEN